MKSASENIASRCGALLQDAAPDVRATRFWALSGGAEPRWLLPESRNASLVVMQHWRPYGVKSRAAWWLITQSMKTPFWRAPLTEMPAHRPIDTKESVNGSWPVIYVGTPGPKRKAVCHIVDERQRTLEILKLPLGSEAATAIAQEAAILRGLPPELAGRIPKLIDFNSDLGTSRQTWLPGRPSGRTFTAAHAEFLTALGTRKEIGVAKVAQEVSSFAKTLPGDLRVRADLSLSRLKVDGRAPIVWRHGDFAPWNLRLQGQVIAAYDWEDGNEASLPLWDAVHFHVMQSWLFKSARPVVDAMRENAAYANYARFYGFSPEEERAIISLYLINQSLLAYSVGDTDFSKRLLDIADELGGAQ